jgi:hypothetical protein
VSGLFIRGGFRKSAFRCCGYFILLVQAGLYFINDAEVADKLGAAGVNEMRLAIGVAVKVDG